MIIISPKITEFEKEAQSIINRKREKFQKEDIRFLEPIKFVAELFLHNEACDCLDEKEYNHKEIVFPGEGSIFLVNIDGGYFLVAGEMQDYYEEETFYYIGTFLQAQKQRYLDRQENLLVEKIRKDFGMYLPGDARLEDAKSIHAFASAENQYGLPGVLHQRLRSPAVLEDLQRSHAGEEIRLMLIFPDGDTRAYDVEV